MRKGLQLYRQVQYIPQGEYIYFGFCPVMQSFFTITPNLDSSNPLILGISDKLRKCHNHNYTSIFFRSTYHYVICVTAKTL